MLAMTRMDPRPVIKLVVGLGHLQSPASRLEAHASLLQATTVVGTKINSHIRWSCRLLK